MSSYIWTGLVLLLLAAGATYMTRRTNRRIESMESTETLTAQELRELHGAAAEAAGPGNFRYQCTVVGTARPHKSGALHSELKNEKCVWHSHKISRKYEEHRHDSEGRPQRRTSTSVISRFSSSTAFFVEDATGKLVVRPESHTVEGAEKVLDHFQPKDRSGWKNVAREMVSDSHTIGIKQEEWLVRPGQQFYVHGEAHDEGDGKLSIGAPVEGGVFVMAAKAKEAVLRSERNRLLGFGIATVVLALAGLGSLAYAVFGH